MGSYNDESKKKIVRLYLENGQSLKSLSDEYNVFKSRISNWVKQYREECQNNTVAKEEDKLMKENIRLKRELEELKKENSFLKRRWHSLQRKSIKTI